MKPVTPNVNPAASHAVQRIVIPWHAARRIGHRVEPRAAAPPPQTVFAVAVAVLYVALAVANGGYSTGLTAAATVGVWWAVVIALAIGGWPRSRLPAAALGAGACLAGLAAWMAISVGWASDDGGTFVEIVRALGYLGVFVLVVISSPRASVRTWLGGLALGLVIVAGLALLSRFEPSFGGGKELGSVPPIGRRQAQLPGRLLERPRRDDGDRRSCSWSGWGATPEPSPCERRRWRRSRCRSSSSIWPPRAAGWRRA